jgi:hypothetical protein
MKKYLLQLSFICSLLGVASNVWAQAPGSSEATGGTAGTSAMALETGDVTASVSETLYIGPGDYTINGTWEIYSKNVWISSDATFTGTGTLKYFNPSLAGGTASPTLIDGNSSANFITVNIELDNTANMVLTDIAGPGAPWTDGTGAANLGIAADFKFNIANGDVLLGNFDMITATASTLTGFAPDRFIVTGGTGHLVHQNYSGNFVYPVGIAEGDYTPAAVNNTAANTLHVMVQDYASSTADESTLPVSNGMDRTWNIYADNATGNSALTLEHNTTTNQGTFSNSSHFVTQWSSGAPNSSGDNTSATAWQSNTLAAGVTGNLSSTGTVAGSTMRTHNYTSFATTAAGSLAFFTKSSNPSVLPIHLISFNGNVVNCNSVLKWITAEEINSDYFELQRSSNGTDFTTMARIATKGSNSAYYYADTITPKGIIYYRLRMVDKNGREEFSNTELLNINCKGQYLITVYPNPAKNTVIISGLTGKNQLRLLSMAGQLLTTIQTVNPMQQLDVRNYPSGTYVLQIIQDDKTIQNIKLVKE